MLEVCQLCGKEFKNRTTVISHVCKQHKIIAVDYYNKFYRKSADEGHCQKCGALTKYLDVNRGFAPYCSRQCSGSSKARIVKASAKTRGQKRTPEQRANYSKAKKGVLRGPLPAEVSRKISKARKGKPSPLRGIPRSPETNRKVSQSLLGHPVSDESRVKMRLAQIRRIERQYFNGEPIAPCIGKHERACLDALEKLLPGERFVRQFNTKIGYFLDGYLPSFHIAVEFDESYHRSTSMKQHDVRRDADILKCLPGIAIFRVDERQWKKDPNLCIERFQSLVQQRGLERGCNA